MPCARREVFVHGPAAAAAAASPDDKLEAGKAETDPMKVSTASSIPWGRLLRCVGRPLPYVVGADGELNKTPLTCRVMAARWMTLDGHTLC
jgi:hypothetical protein